MRLPDGDRTAKSIIWDEAIRLFAEHGADAVSIRKIAVAAAVSPALVIQHYGSKNGLRDAVDAFVVGRLDAALDEATRSDRVPDATELVPTIAGLFPADSPRSAYLGRLLLGVLAAAGIVLYLIGSGLNTGSEYFRKRWNQEPANAGQVFMGGLFHYSVHINY